MQNYLIALVEKRMETPEDDMLSDIIRADTPDEEPLTFEELVATARMLLINTHDSMSTAFTNILFKVATDTAIAQEFTPRPTTIRRWGVSSRNSCGSNHRYAHYRV